MRSSLRAVASAAAVGSLCAAALAGTASAAPAPAPHPRVVLGPQAVSGLTPFAGCTTGGPIGTVHPGAEVEPWTITNPRNPANVVTAWQQDRWSNGASRGLVAGVTHDFGRHWKETFPKFSACEGNPSFDRASDPGLAFSADGRVLYMISLSVDHVSPTTGLPDTSAIVVATSRDGGDTWSDPITLKRDDDPTGTFFNDKELITADPRDPNKAYAVWDRSDERASQPIWFSQTDDGGRTWSPARIIHDPTGDPNDPRFTIDNHILVLPDGTLVDTYAEGSNLNGDGSDWRGDAQGTAAKARKKTATPLDVEPFRQQVIRSTDGGTTWSAPITVSTFTLAEPVDPAQHRGIRSADLVPSYTVDQHSGALYATWQDGGFSTSGSAIVVSSSKDGGLTWTKPIKVNKTPDSAAGGSGQAFIPAVDVSSTGTVGVTYYDFRNYTGGPVATTDYWAVTCKGGPACATDPSKWREQHVGGSFDLTLAATVGGGRWFLGDYMGLYHDGPVFVSDFTMTHAVPDNQQDIYTAGIVP